MPIDRIALIGAGGHAKVVLDALRLAHPRLEVRVLDEAHEAAGRKLLGLAVEPLTGEWQAAFHVAIGGAAERERIATALQGKGASLFSVVHPAASVAPASEIGEGSFIAAQAIVAPDVRIGRGVIVNHGAIVDHDCVVGDWSHVAPGATLGGGVKVGRCAMIGAGANVLPGVSVADYATVGAGAVVNRDVARKATVKGVPAK